MEDTAANADCHGLRSILRTELVHDALDVELHGLFGDREALANSPIAVAFGNPLQNFDLSPVDCGMAIDPPT